MNDLELHQVKKSSRDAREYFYRSQCRDAVTTITNLRKAYNDLWAPEPFFVAKAFRLILKILDALENQTSLKSKRR